MKAKSPTPRRYGLAIIAMGLLAYALPLVPCRAEVLIFESFGLGTATNPRLDAAGTPQPLFLGHDLSGIRAEFPNSSAVVWRAPGGHQVQTWQFSVSSADPFEPFSPLEPDAAGSVNNGSVTVGGGIAPAIVDVLVDFSPPSAQAYKISADVLPGGDPTTGTAIGFTGDGSVLNNNFATSGQAWLRVRGGSDLVSRTWELHTNGTAGPSVSGDVPFTSGWFRLELTVDPVRHTVSAVVSGVPTPVLSSTAGSITAAGIEGTGTAENFAVETVATPERAPAAASLSVSATFQFDRNNTFGWRFTPNYDIDVTELGFFDMTTLASGGASGLVQPHDVGIFGVSDGALLASVTIPAGTAGTLNGYFRYMPLANPLRLLGGATYLVGAVALSASPDQLASSTTFTMAPGVTYANSGGGEYIVSGKGNPPDVLTYPAVLHTGILPTFSSNFRFTAVVPQLRSLVQTAGNLVVNVADPSIGATYTIEKSPDLLQWQFLKTFVPTASATDVVLEPPFGSRGFYRLRWAP